PKAFLVFFFLSVMCFGADRLKRYIAQRKTLAAELAQAKKLEAIGILAGGVAHDMNNTLNVILSSVYALKEEPEFRGKDFRDIDTIIAACDRGAQLTQNLLGFARKSNYRQQIFSLTNVVADVLSILERTANKGIQIRVSHSTVPPLILGDKAQIENAIMNLCLNALDAMSEKGQLTISTSSNTNEVTIRVSDTGTGMDRSVQDRIFEPFYTTKPEGKGTGLGLSMVYGVVHSMKGRIAINSAPGQGTNITLTFPAAPADAALLSQEKTAPQAQRTANILEGRTVLLIDDEPLVLRAGERMLKSIGCKVIGAASGKAGIEQFKGNHTQIAMVLLDLIMPDLDGIATLESLLQIDNTIPVILVSGYTRESEKMTNLKELGDNVRFLSKPYRPTQIIAIAQELLNNLDS
ncbi:MAG: response regulator, partial [Deltaproteobacteria bacterium]|nr:response regulator [Deltaproteobacteria bacterium]